MSHLVGGFMQKCDRLAVLTAGQSTAALEWGNTPIMHPIAESPAEDNQNETRPENQIMPAPASSMGR